jgi:hypothetical protein
MAAIVSFRVAPGLRVYSTGSGAVAVALLGGAIYAYLWSLLFVAAVACFFGLVLGMAALAIQEAVYAKRRGAFLLARSIAPASVARSGRLASPPTFGVYCIEGLVSGRRELQYRVGNHPVRHAELTREFGAAVLLGLFLSRADAEEFRHLLATRRVCPPAILEA